MAALSLGAVLAACGAQGTGTGTSASSGGGGDDGGGGGATTGGGDGSSSSGDFNPTDPGVGGGAPQPLGFTVEPSDLQTIAVAAGQTPPSVSYAAVLMGAPINVGWSVDRGELGAIGAGPASMATFTPKGTTGGLVTVRAGLNGETVERKVLIQLTAAQNGADAAVPAQAQQIPTDPAQLTLGGGVGGVGGEGLGAAVTSEVLLDALQHPASDGQAEKLTFLYPYDGTVWPRGLLAPLLMWRWAHEDADAIQIELRTTSGSFSWRGTFARPEILATTGGPFIRHPIPQDVWTMATDSAGGPTPDGSPDRLTVSLTVAREGQAYGPISQTWTIAPARLSGVIYYNSYGTWLAENHDGAVGGNGRFGGAVLSIKAGDTAPRLVAGGNGDTSQCRVCHSVAADGSRMVVQNGINSYGVSQAYDLTPAGAVEHDLSAAAPFAAVYPDGSLALTQAGELLSLPNSTRRPISGLDDVAYELGTPAFSPDGALVVFNAMYGADADIRKKLFVMKFNAATGAFTDPAVIVDDTGEPEGTRPGWPAFLPDSKSVVFHHQTDPGNEGDDFGDLRTRRGAKAHLAWASADGSGAAVPLAQLNGRDAAGGLYLPSLSAPVEMTCTADETSVGSIDNRHKDDVNMNYEPTVNPVASGGYAWVVFTSRRLYGNAATIPPFCSDPRGVDLVENITTKKLWVAAIDLNAAPGTDPSHPAFYLPAQELLAGNARGYWVLDPCRSEGAACDTGDQCCGGYCQPGADGELVCSNAPPDGRCSQPQERCETAADCCDPTNRCINGFCAVEGPR
ncbi:hypothetical protein [Sorangium cellulosum]|uniref:hypothetical protein n=1 Tax=Sorangium cellulosum TaxID=56 RepID=UPI000CF4E59D|nr:hypothetical protein [Sorangium cellulosum]